MAFIQSCSSLTPSVKSKLNSSSLRSSSIAPVHHARMSLSSDLVSGTKAAVLTAVIVASSITMGPLDSHASIFNFSGEKPATIGLRYGRYLDNCPPSKNCISSSANVYDSHYVPSWTYNAISGQPAKTMSEAIKDVTKVIEEYPGTKIIKSEATDSDVGKGHYLYAEFKSKIFGFVDDVEFFFQPDNTTVEYRSASRLGEDDLGANRKRIRDLRVALQETDKRWASMGY